MVLGLSGLTAAKYVQSSPLLLRFVKPVANAYAWAAGYRQLGLKYDDLLIEENANTQRVSVAPNRAARAGLGDGSEVWLGRQGYAGIQAKFLRVLTFACCDFPFLALPRQSLVSLSARPTTAPSG